jgi:hypothetical protein
LAIVDRQLFLRMQRRTVLKRLDADCLLDGQLHPAIRQRLERVRELPVKCVANLHGVERIDGVAQLVWDFVPGTPLAEWETDDWLRVAREVVLAVQSLHAVGIVHGAIHARNVILDARGEVRLTHVSPLLYVDPGQDAADVAAMLGDLVAERDYDSPLAETLATAEAERWTLDQLYARLAEANVEPPTEPAVEPAPTVRTRSLAWAAVAAAIGAAITIGVVWSANRDALRPAAE